MEAVGLADAAVPVGTKGLGMVRCSCQNMPLVAMDPQTTVIHSGGKNFLAYTGSINSRI